tara:strand:- start:2 stop:1078 length:1077 start_codon:yes stop_codon:yes gene_type:complete
MNTNEKILDKIVAFAVDIQRYEASIQNDVFKQLKSLESKVLKELRESEVSDTLNKQRQQKKLKALLIKTKATITQAYKDLSKDQITILKEVAELSELQVVSSINASLGATIIAPKLSQTMINTIASDTLIEGAPTKEWWSRKGAQFQSKFEDTVRMGMMQGIPTSEIVRTLRGTKANRYKDGAMQSTFNGANALVRSSIQTVANTANTETFQQNKDVIESIQWSATFDNRTSVICMSLDGLRWDMDYKPIGHSKVYPGSTAHWNCRSRQIPVTKSWEELGSKKKFRTIPKGTRASMDGQVAPNKNYEQWLRGKSKAFQIEVLGVQKRKLWIEGKMGFSDLINQTGNPLTLAEIKAKVS